MGLDLARRRDAYERGLAAEEAVARVLAEAGWRILARNWRGGGGELDLVAQQGGRLRFVEVKARTGDVATGLEAITASKRHRLSGAARAWLTAHATVDFDECCFLVVLVDLEGLAWTFDWYDDAFDAG